MCITMYLNTIISLNLWVQYIYDRHSMLATQHGHMQIIYVLFYVYIILLTGHDSNMP